MSIFTNLAYAIQGIKIKMRLLAMFTLPMLVLLSGCGGSEKFSTASTTGTVLCNGQPVEGAMVYFEPIPDSSKKGSMVGKQGFSWTDSQGKFVRSTYDPGGEDGAVVGMHRVRVGKGKSKCDCETNDEKDLMQVEVKSGESNVFDLVLPKQYAGQRSRGGQNADDQDED